ncbi:hypothetical protein HH310_19705 [Actinoplanes sp. TBRC 11911]|uniref:class III lanthionine synthetase LanKC N-terminal domain-containing protein n=1 Tax=Actinoplanes sp. TBRC 11911 TaxID=2729386 RepID=UPI00145E730D|nr:hypothetical protein [Actinoplanes sp. TBRC 11911]NMO53403.1 hypothetical protein [Actinoplanes sp. TBRC 11911]
MRMWCPGENDEAVPAIEDVGGELVPDHRGPVFAVPPWVEIPAILRPHLAARRSGGPVDFPYRVDEALQVSNGGGIYLARNAAGEKVVLREARPHAGLDCHRADAVARLRREHAVLTRLAGLDDHAGLQRQRGGRRVGVRLGRSGGRDHRDQRGADGGRQYLEYPLR